MANDVNCFIFSFYNQIYTDRTKAMFVQCYQFPKSVKIRFKTNRALVFYLQSIKIEGFNSENQIHIQKIEKSTDWEIILGP